MTYGSFQNIDFEPVSCMVCGHDEPHPAGAVTSHGSTFNYAICTRCGLKYMNPRPTTAWYNAHYADHFWEYKQTNRSWHDQRRRWRLRDVFRRGQAGRKRHQSKRLSILTPLLRAHSRLSNGGTLLDVGCAYGVIGAGLRSEFGCEVWGVEPNATARTTAANENGIQILVNNAKELIDLESCEVRFDVILFSNVLENILDPVPILTSCKRLLNDGGVVCVHTPNFFYYDSMNPYHPYIFSAQTAGALLGKAGLGIVATDATPAASLRNGATSNDPWADRFLTLFASADAAPAAPAVRTDHVSLCDEQVRSLALHAKMAGRKKRILPAVLRRLSEYSRLARGREADMKAT